MKRKKILFSAFFILTGLFFCFGSPPAAGEDVKPVSESKYGAHTKHVDELNEQLAKDSNNTDLLMELAKVYGWAKDLDSAVRTYERVLEINPDHLEAKRKLGDFYSWTRQPEKSLRMLEAVYAQEPDNLDVMKKLGDRYMRLKRYPEASALFSKILEREPDNQDAKRGLADIKSARSEHDDAIRAYQDMLQTAASEKERVELFDKVSDNYYYARDYGKAKEYAEEMLKIDPENKEAQGRLKRIDEYFRPTIFSEYKYQDYKGDQERSLLDVGYIQPTRSGITVTGVYHNYRRYEQEDKTVERYGYDSGSLDLSKYMGEGLTVSVGTELKFYTTDAADFDYHLRAVKDFMPGLRGDFVYEKERQDTDFDRLRQHVDAHSVSGTMYHDWNDWFSLHSNLEGRYYTQGDAFDDNFRVSGYVSPVFHIIKRDPVLDVSYTYYRVFSFVKDRNASDEAERFEYFAPRRFQRHSVTMYFVYDFTKQLRVVASDTVSWIDEDDADYVQNTILGELIYKISDDDRVSLRYIETHHVHNGSETDFKNNEWRVQASHRF